MSQQVLANSLRVVSAKRGNLPLDVNFDLGFNTC